MVVKHLNCSSSLLRGIGSDKKKTKKDYLAVIIYLTESLEGNIPDLTPTEINFSCNNNGRIK